MVLYDDLMAPAADGLIVVENDTHEDKTRIKLRPRDRPAAILNAYGGVDYNALIEHVYEKYPEHAKKSRIRRKVKG